ncbi:MAG: ribosome maturation factor RimP [Alphaproteobacteria bacterium]|nr:ribosome maturation factor RimP [Alphaproteobacteria bacterium]
MEICTKLEEMATPSLTNLGYEIVRITLQGGDVKTVQIMAERIDRANMTLGDCETISRTVSALLDIEDPFQGKYMLEVSSPGIDRPLVRPADYVRFKGFNAKIETVCNIDGRKRFKGCLKSFDEATQTVIFQFEDKELNIPFGEIAKAKLLLTDDSIQKQPKKKIN